MPTSKQARARQARQKERLAVLQAERAQKRRRFRRLFAVGGALVVIVGIVLAIFVVPNSGSNSSSPTTVPATTAAPTTPTTTATLQSVKGRPCVAMKGSVPAGAPNVPVQVGPAPTTLVVKDLKTGTGAAATSTSKITADYIGVACSTGKVFGSSFGSQAFTAQLPKDVIQGWQYGIPGMKVGGQRLLGIPAAMAYGAQGRPPDIAPDEALWFVIQLKNVA